MVVLRLAYFRRILGRVGRVVEHGLKLNTKHGGGPFSGTILRSPIFLYEY